MNDDLLASIQPGAGSEPAAPAAPAAPEPPTPPAAPVDGGGDEGKLTPEEQADADEWDTVAKELFPGLRSANEEKDKKGEQTKPDQGTQEDGAGEEAASDKKSDEGDGKSTVTPPEKSDGEAAKGDDDAGTNGGNQEDEPTGPPELTASDRQQLETNVKAEISQKMFTQEVNGKTFVSTPSGTKYLIDANGRPALADADGDPIRTIDDVMKLINPRTGQTFTEEQAGMYLLNAQQQMRENIADMQTQIDNIASTGLTMKEESNAITWQYGELLEAMPELTKELWADYEKTLVKDPKTGIVIKAPVSLQRFYERALEPYAELGRKLEADAANKTVATAQVQQQEQHKQEQQQQAKQQRRADRSDIYGGGKVDTTSDEDKEWAAAAENVFGPLKNL